MYNPLFALFFMLLSFGYPIVAQQYCSAPKITDVLGNEDPIIDCAYPLNGKCLQLNVSYPEFFKTSSYAVSAENYTPYGAYNAGTPIDADADDLFIKKIPISFDFCFYENTYSEVVIGSNGMITFDTDQLGKINYPNIAESNPSVQLPSKSIFGTYHDLIFSKNDDSEIYYSVIGAAPCRKLVINFYKGKMLGCTDTSTSQIVLSEGSNTIEIFVQNKVLPCATAKFANALIGIINSDGTAGTTPPGRNSGVWAAQNEAWKFSPNGAPIIPQINWYNSLNENIGSGDSINVCPEKNEIYTAKVSYASCGSNDFVLEDVANLTFVPEFPLAKDYTQLFCTGNSVSINLNDYRGDLTPQNAANFIFTFHNTLAEAESGTNAQPTSFVLTSNMRFYVRVQSATNPLCFRTSVLNLNILSDSLLTNQIEICDFENDNSENNYQLSKFNSKLFSFPINGNIRYFLTEADALANINEVTNANIVSGIQLFVNYQTTTCTQTFGPITINLISSPVVNTPITYYFTTCDIKNDYFEIFDYLLNLGPLVTLDSNFVLTFYKTYQEAFSGVGSPLTTIVEGKYPIYVRVQDLNGCFSIAVINLEVVFTKVVAKDDTVYICFDGVQDISINLDDYAPDMLLDSPIGITTRYFLTQGAGVANVNWTSNLQVITTDGDFVTKTFYVRFTNADGCYALKPLTINLVHVVIKKSQLEVCDAGNDGEENVLLSIFSNQIKGNQNATVTYYPTLLDAQNNTGSLSNYLVQNTTKLYVKIESYGCVDFFEINIKLVSSPIVNVEVVKTVNSVCDNNNDGTEFYDLTQLQAEIYAGSESVTYAYYQNYDPITNAFSGLISSPSNHPVSASTVIYVKIMNSAGCYSISKITLQLNFLPAIVLKSAALEKCDYEFNLNEIFNLDDAASQLFIATDNSIPLSDLEIHYYNTNADATAGISTTRIGHLYTAVDSKITVWARFTSLLTGCFSIAPIELTTYVPPKAVNSIIKDLCDDNLDGFFDVNLTQFTDEMVYDFETINNFTFFYSKADADSNNNPIPNPEFFSANPFPLMLWVRVENIPGCFDTASIQFTFGQKLILNNPGPFVITNTCDIDNDGVENVDLTQFENAISATATQFEYYPSMLDLNNDTNKILKPQEYLFDSNSSLQRFFVKVNAAGFCPEKTEITVALKTTPIFTLSDYYFCPGGDVDIKPDFSTLDIVSFQWLNPAGEVVSTSNELLDVRIAGLYTINVVAGNDCTFSTSFNVKEYEVPVITELIANGNSYTVIATGSQTILYSIDGINFQSSNVFPNLPFGVTTFYVKFEGSACLGLPKEGLILDIKNVFTPNRDGINDTWIIKDLYVFDGKKTNLKVYNRFGNMIYEQESSTRLEWNGTTNSRLVPTASYWYMLTLADGRIFNGWVLVKNRD